MTPQPQGAPQVSNPKESPRITGKKLGFKVADKVVWPDMSKAVLEPADASDTETFGSITAGSTQMQLTISAIQSTSKASLWRYLFDHVGEEVSFEFAPNGNPTATADQPHVTGKCVIEKPPTLSTEVKSTSTFELTLPVTSWQLKES